MKLVDFTQVENIFIVCGKTDMRRQIDGLAATITEEYDGMATLFLTKIIKCKNQVLVI